nr:DinB family protein [uncultured Holophaga sp.]
MFRRIRDFLVLWEQESQASLRVFRAIPDAAMSHLSAPEGRDLARLAWHLVEGLIELPGRMGLRVEGSDLVHGGFICAPPVLMEEIIQAYERASASLASQVGGWSDATLDIQDDMYGELWARGLSLMVLITHQAHHRGQMTVLLRQAGLRVPEVYGPVREDWAGFGMKPPKV